MTTQSEPRRWWLRAAALGQLLLLAGVLWLAADRKAHEQVHPDTNHPEHECVVTLFAHGKTDATFAPSLIVVAPQNFFFLPELPPAPVVVTTPAHLLPFACGPPCV